MGARTAVVALALLVGGFSGVVAAKPRRVPNMPRGWTWPPSAKMKSVGKACLEELDALGVAYERAKPAPKIATPITLPDLKIGELELQSIFRKPPFTMDCHLALSLARIAPQLRLIGITALRFTTIHDYRTIRRGKKKSRILSRHAIGLAMDVFEVELADGRVLVVEDDYPKEPALLALEEAVNAREDFRTVLSPKTDPKGHDDHFHLEARMFLVGPPPKKKNEGEDVGEKP